MADPWRRYLRQQVELGGPEVVLPEAAGTPRRSAAADEVAPPVEAPSRPVPVAAPAAEEARWRKGAPPIPGPGLSVTTSGGDLVAAAEALADLAAVASAVSQCRRCPLCEGRTHTVPGEGDPAARLMLVGEGPGATEDETGRPFVGQAGKLLEDILGAIDIARERVFIANIVKCRPPKNRKPLPDEVQACLPYLYRQMALIRPKVILALGGTAAESLLGVKKSLGQLRGQVHRLDGTPLVVTYHPAALLRNPNWKKPTWDDVRIARQLLDD